VTKQRMQHASWGGGKISRLIIRAKSLGKNKEEKRASLQKAFGSSWLNELEEWHGGE